MAVRLWDWLRQTWPGTPAAEKAVLLILADISGYTDYMLASQKALVHGQHHINTLMKAIIRQVRIPLKVAKLEGDAVFLYATISPEHSHERQPQKTLGDKLLQFFDTFSTQLQALEQDATCTCEACSNIGQLRLKIIVHAGSAIFYRIGEFNELGGIDVIIAHRLLKNTVNLDEYLLMTEAAYSLIRNSGTLHTVRHEESYKSLGTILTYIYPVQRAAKGIETS